MKALRITTLLLLGAAALTAGCTVDPFCLDCVDGSVEDTGPEDTGPFDGDIDGGDADADGDGDGDADADAEGCIEELCNGEDDDCDGEVDEDFDLMSNPRHCGRCNNPCELAHAFNACDEGECLIDGCDVCFHDVDGVSTNGCEYACCETESPTVEGSCESGDCCDGVDNDCDGETDEDHDTSNDPLNCGGCSAGCVEGEPCPFRCDYILGIGACVDGVCELSGCVEGHYDVNGDPDDGCEYACTPNPDTGGVEQCNSRDDDCDGEVDESFDGMGDVCGSDEGACETGVLSCDRGAEVCEGEVSPTEDLCDGLDNDCDGETDEDDSRLGGGCSTNMGECVRGTYGCLDGSLVCQGGVDPTVETCNGLDDNCNGVVDDGIADEGSCGTDEGECTAGTRVCLGGRFVCDGSMGPRLEDCNGLDDDCDGEVDEELVRDCSNECGVGEESCADGDWVGCTARVAQPEVCDGADNDCDGSIDEADEGGPLTRSCTEGSCSGVEICLDADTWSSCSVSPRAEECDGEDNDCDGTIDEDVVESCTDDCGPGERTCVVGGVGTWGECVNREPSAEVCDGIDNDCDGDVDEAADGSLLTRDCSFLECSGEETCTAPFTWTGCTASASVEVCDGEDNDCDGEVDENLLRSCGTLCGPGEESCTDGAWGGCTAREPTGEICDGIDNDCNGTADDGLTRACSTVCGDGLESCTGPDTWGGCTAPEPEAEVCDGADNDCDGEIDEDVDLATDPTNCGSCGRDCHSLIPNAAVRCEEGDCVLVACAAGFWDLDPDEPGCEYPCTVTGGESCDGIDNDCNGVVDDWTPPADYCGFYGVCSGVVVDCRDPDGAGAEPVQPICDYGVDYQADETWCDGLDNDCDGTADEGYDVGLAYPCDNGLLGRCFTAGHWECGDDLLSRECLLDEVPLEPADELCNGIDDDCDGAVDDAIALADLDLVQVVADVDLDGDSTVGVGTDEEAHEVWMFAFEASPSRRQRHRGRRGLELRLLEHRGGALGRGELARRSGGLLRAQRSRRRRGGHWWLRLSAGRGELGGPLDTAGLGALRCAGVGGGLSVG